ncbi:MAG: hypothetical protein R3B06_16155 [Kofleriaceae bacterium]
MRWQLAAAAVLAVACRDRRPAGPEAAPVVTAPVRPEAAAAPGASGALDGCEAIPYASQVAVPEASGAAWLPDVGRLVVVSDSGNAGAYVELDAAGAVVGGGQLPLGSAGDDVEGLALDGGTLWGLASNGWLRAWTRDAAGSYQLVDGYALDDRCGPASVNCGANYEGLCLAPAPLADGCDGYAASKDAGTLVCLRRAGARLQRDDARAYQVAEPGRLADCAVAADGTVWTGDNGFSLGQVRQWAIGADGASLVGASRLGLGFPEVLAFGPPRPGASTVVVYRLSDMGGSPSLATAYQCPARLPKAGPAAPAE